MSNDTLPNAAPGKLLSPAAKRALAEAAARKKKALEAQSDRPDEKGGPKPRHSACV